MHGYKAFESYPTKRSPNPICLELPSFEGKDRGAMSMPEYKAFESYPTKFKMSLNPIF